MPLEQRQHFLDQLTDEEALVLTYDWGFWGRPDQHLPASLLPGAAHTAEGAKNSWLALAGRGWGKTRVGSEAILQEVESGRSGRIALIAETAADARDVMVEGPSGILTCAPPWNRPAYEPSKRRLTWPNGAMAFTYNAVEPDQLRGPQFDFAWGDELAKWMYAQDTYDNLQFGLRLGTWPRQIFTTTPRPIPIVRDLIADPMVHVTKGRTLDNADNLAAPFISTIRKKYEGTRLGRQELDAEVLNDVPGAYWTRAMLDRALIREVPVDLRRIVVAVDPSGSDGKEEAIDRNDDIGIIVAALGVDDRGYVLADGTINDSPQVWGQRAVDLYRSWGADRIIGEQNYGGAMVEFVIRSVDREVSYKKITASRGKAVRAEPVAALYEQGRISHVGGFPALEDEMCLMARDGYIGRGSPNRLDALVWALTELMVDSQVKSEGLLILAQRANALRQAQSLEPSAERTTVPAVGSVEYMQMIMRRSS